MAMVSRSIRKAGPAKEIMFGKRRSTQCMRTQEREAIKLVQRVPRVGLVSLTVYHYTGNKDWRLAYPQGCVVIPGKADSLIFAYGSIERTGSDTPRTIYGWHQCPGRSLESDHHCLGAVPRGGSFSPIGSILGRLSGNGMPREDRRRLSLLTPPTRRMKGRSCATIYGLSNDFRSNWGYHMVEYRRKWRATREIRSRKSTRTSRISYSRN
jgi:hypothetical protein